MPYEATIWTLLFDIKHIITLISRVKNKKVIIGDEKNLVFKRHAF